MRIVRAWKWEKEDSVALAIYAARLCLKKSERILTVDTVSGRLENRCTCMSNLAKLFQELVREDEP
jgi:signal recognition particle GTPase